MYFLNVGLEHNRHNEATLNYSSSEFTATKEIKEQAVSAMCVCGGGGSMKSCQLVWEISGNLRQ